jgi:hypothetical protein
MKTAGLLKHEISLKKIKSKIKLINISLPNGNPIENKKRNIKITWMINI